MGSQDLQQARYDQLVRRLGALYGGGSKVVEVLPELFPVIDVENLPPEALAYTGWRTSWQMINQGNVAAQTSACELSNPAGSGILASVTQVIIRVGTTDSIQMEVNAAPLVSAAIRGLFRDGRAGGQRATVCELRADPNVATGAGLRLFITAGDLVTVRDDNGLVVLSPGSAFRVGSTGTNIFLDVNFLWRERTAEPSELNFP